MKKFSAFITLLLFSVSLTYAQKSNTNKSKKIYTENWRLIKSKNNYSGDYLDRVVPRKKGSNAWTSVRPNKKINTNMNSSKSKTMNSLVSHSRPKKQNKSTYSNSLNNSLSNKGVNSSGALTKARTTVRKPNKRSTKKKKLFSEKKENN